MTMEQRMDQLEKRNRRLTAALTLMVPHLKRRANSYANW